MDPWQIKHVTDNLTGLVEKTSCSPMLLSKLVASGVLASHESTSLMSKPDMTTRCYRLYEIIQTRENAYDIMRQALLDEKQTGAAKLLAQRQEATSSKFDESSNFKLSYDESHLLGGNVYAGTFGRIGVAVKVIGRKAKENLALSEIEMLTKFSSEPNDNIVRYYTHDEKSDLILIAMELCNFSLAEFIKSGYCSTQEIKKQILLQTTKGLDYLHDPKRLIVHMRLNPENILIKMLDGENFSAKLANFGKSCKDGNTQLLPDSFTSDAVASIVWLAPELISVADNHNTDITREVDIFALGCLFYYVISRGDHPFGDYWHCPGNIVDGKHEMTNIHFSRQLAEFYLLIESMISHSATERPLTSYIQNYIAFWSSEETLRFLSEILYLLQHNNRRVRACFDKYTESLKHLEWAGPVLTNRWVSLLCPRVQDYIDSVSCTDVNKSPQEQLLSLVVHLYNEYAELPKKVKSALGDMHDGFLCYWTRRFPFLVSLMWIHFGDAKDEIRLNPFYKSLQSSSMKPNLSDLKTSNTGVNIYSLFGRAIESKVVNVETITRPALGSIANLGDLYDATKDEFCGISIFKNTIPESCKSIIKRKSSNLKLVKGDSFTDKCFSLNVNPSLQVTLIAGSVPLKEHGRFLADDKKFASVVQKSLIYSTFTCEETVNFYHEDLKTLLVPNALKCGVATHIVAEISWGACCIATCLSKRKNLKCKAEKENYITSQLNKICSSLNPVLNDQSTSSDQKTETDDLYEYKVFSDMCPIVNESSINLNGLLHIMRIMPSLSSACNEGKGRPLSYRLIPLSTLQKCFQIYTKETPLFRNIDSKILAEIILLYNQISESVQRLNDFYQDVDDYMYCVSPSDLLKIGNHRNEIEVLKDLLKYKISNIVCAYRSGENTSEQMEPIMKHFHFSELSPQRVASTLESWDDIIQKIQVAREFENTGALYVSFGVDIWDILKNQESSIILLFSKKGLTKELELFRKEKQFFISIMETENDKHRFYVIDCDIHERMQMKNYTSVIQRFQFGQLISENWREEEESLAQYAVKSFVSRAKEWRRKQMYICFYALSDDQIWLQAIKNLLEYHTFSEMLSSNAGNTVTKSKVLVSRQVGEHCIDDRTKNKDFDIQINNITNMFSNVEYWQIHMRISDGTIVFLNPLNPEKNTEVVNTILQILPNYDYEKIVFCVPFPREMLGFPNNIRVNTVEASRISEFFTTDIQNLPDLTSMKLFYFETTIVQLVGLRKPFFGQELPKENIDRKWKEAVAETVKMLEYLHILSIKRFPLQNVLHKVRAFFY